MSYNKRILNEILSTATFSCQLCEQYRCNAFLDRNERGTSGTKSGSFIDNLAFISLIDNRDVINLIDDIAVIILIDDIAVISLIDDIAVISTRVLGTLRKSEEH